MTPDIKKQAIAAAIEAFTSEDPMSIERRMARAISSYETERDRLLVKAANEALTKIKLRTKITA